MPGASDELFWENAAEAVLEKLLERIPENKVRPRLEPTRRAVELLGDPQRSYRIIHITGTNGKTSTTRFIERILREHGIRTGRFTSPHLIRLNERMAIDGEPVENERLVTIFGEIEPILEIVDAELVSSGETKLTFFEALAVLGFAIFADAPVEVLVLEVGMGGAWDSTNVADGDVAVFTPIGLDHMERLGNTVEEIARTKSGIIKPGSHVVTSRQSAEAVRVIKDVAGELASDLSLMGEHFDVESSEPTESGQRVSIRGLAGRYGPFHAPVFGAHQSENLAVAVAAVEAFLGGGKNPISDDVLRSALSDVSSPGRLQLIQSSPPLLLDGAHNPAGAETLSLALRGEFGNRKLVGLMSVLEDKDIPGVLEALKGIFSAVVFTQSTSPRARAAIYLRDMAPEGFANHIEVEPDFELALARAEQLAAEIEGTVVITGSISLIGDTLKKLQEESDAE